VTFLSFRADRDPTLAARRMEPPSDSAASVMANGGREPGVVAPVTDTPEVTAPTPTTAATATPAPTATPVPTATPDPAAATVAGQG
jgi:hypothetical protein